MTLPDRLLPDRLLVVVEPAAARPETLLPLTRAGARWFWLRAKGLPEEETRRLLGALRQPLAAAGATLSLGLPAEAAQRHAAKAVHLPGDGDPAAARRLLGSDPLIGQSAHSLEQVEAAAAGGLDYVTFSPVFPSAGKPGYGPDLGLGGLRSAASAGLPLVALGGITPERAADCLAAGAAAVAVLGSLLGADDPLAALARFRRAMT